MKVPVAISKLRTCRNSGVIPAKDACVVLLSMCIVPNVPICGATALMDGV